MNLLWSLSGSLGAGVEPMSIFAAVVATGLFRLRLGGSVAVVVILAVHDDDDEDGYDKTDS